ncbi:hypothetical protein EYF80_006585 [Liparis tanakae]|uniref:Uncharacterized protein n=1 Tax=Liparis tanakae TaxID=230148 RepID=A0A4Z2J153_9TELE|nr:hypothetical protein EYF80_006585 [Liparis tanakae]
MENGERCVAREAARLLGRGAHVTPHLSRSLSRLVPSRPVLAGLAFPPHPIRLRSPLAQGRATDKHLKITCSSVKEELAKIQQRKVKETGRSRMNFRNVKMS